MPLATSDLDVFVLKLPTDVRPHMFEQLGVS